MNPDKLRKFCLSLPDTVEEIKFGSDVYYSVAGEVFCTTSADVDSGVSFQLKAEEFREMSRREGIIPAPYLAREHWIYVLAFSWLSKREWEHFILQSYQMAVERAANPDKS